MPLSVFTDQSCPPGEAELVAALGASAKPWRSLRAAIEAACAPIHAEWGYTSKSTGWGMRLKHGDRVLVYMTPGAGHFLVSFALGEKAVTAARATKLAAPVLAAIDSAPRYAEGRGVRIEVRSAALVESLVELTRIKHANGPARSARSPRSSAKRRPSA